jgi:hypothetical protein
MIDHVRKVGLGLVSNSWATGYNGARDSDSAQTGSPAGVCS